MADERYPEISKILTGGKVAKTKAGKPGSGFIKSKNGRWYVLASDKKTILGSHPSHAEALKQFQAIVIARLKAGKGAPG